MENKRGEIGDDPTVKDKMLLHRICSVLALSGTLFVVGCASKPVVQENRRIFYVPEFYTVQAGESLSSIAAKFNLNYLDVAKLNSIESVDRIYVNQSLRLRASDRSASRLVQTKPIEQAVEIKRENVAIAKPIVTTPPTTNVIATPPVANTATITPAVITANTTNLQWRMPSKGTIVQGFDATQNRKGLQFSGSKGDPIYAASAGEVVYSDDGLKEYGKLILLRHSNGYITAYAHNEKLLAKVGDKVTSGQQIATMGDSGADRVMLEFQIRLDGKPIDPRTVLPMQ